MTIESFETFLNLMEKNWPQAKQEMILAMPLIDRIQSTNASLRNKVMAEYGLQSSDFGLLTALRRSQEPHLLTPTQLMEHMLISSGGLTKALYRLEDKEMISRSPSPDDGRIRLVELTQKGKNTIEDIVAKEVIKHQELRSIFTQDEADILDMLLTRLLQKMEENSE